MFQICQFLANRIIDNLEIELDDYPTDNLAIDNMNNLDMLAGHCFELRFKPLLKIIVNRNRSGDARLDKPSVIFNKFFEFVRNLA